MKRQNRKKRRNRRHRPLEGNIKAKPIYDPFPKDGLVKQYEPYIRKVVGEFAKHYPRVSHQDFLFRAVELAHAAEKTFKPELGFDFSTYLGGFARDGRLKELHRLHDKLEKDDGVEIYRTEEDIAHEKVEEDGEPTDPVNFAGGGNGVRLLFDLQWWEALLSDIACHFEGAIGPMFQKTNIHGVDEGTREPVSPAASPGKDAGVISPNGQRRLERRSTRSRTSSIRWSRWYGRPPSVCTVSSLGFNSAKATMREPRMNGSRRTCRMSSSNSRRARAS